jgi:hypothetical protein
MMAQYHILISKTTLHPPLILQNNLETSKPFIKMELHVIKARITNIPFEHQTEELHIIIISVGASLMLTLNDERKRVQNVLFCGENREDEESFVYGEL